jgi:uncharacterized protein YceK
MIVLLLAGCATSSSTTPGDANAGPVAPAGCTQIADDLQRVGTEAQVFGADVKNADARDTLIGYLEAVKSDWQSIRAGSLTSFDKQLATNGITATHDFEKAVWAANDGSPGAVSQINKARQELSALEVPGVCGS